MNTLIIMMGLPRSGKSTFCKKLQKKGYVVVCPDDIRMAMYNKAFIREMEEYVWATVKTMIKSLFFSGHDKIILDATNLSRNTRERWKNINGVEYVSKVVFIDTDVETCLKRAENEDNCILQGVVHEMNERFINKYLAKGIDIELNDVLVRIKNNEKINYTKILKLLEE